MRLLRNRLLGRTIALFFLITFLNTILFPSVSYALTSGPTAPEYSSFEPVDTTDMVDLSTGDFNYSIPLLDVPSPEGGYPLAMSYHAGINAEEEASWVGLGWSLNAGAINRYVNGYADDLNNATESISDVWAGGETNTFSVGVGVAGVNAGLMFANDTYKGNGVGGYVGYSYSGIGISASAGPYGGSSVEIGLTSAVPGSAGTMAGTVGVGIYTDENGSSTVSPYYGVKGLGLQVSISSEGVVSPSASFKGVSVKAVNGSISSAVSSSSSGFNITVPIYIFTVSVGSSYSRYFMSNSDKTAIFGSLYANKLPVNPQTIDNIGADLSKPTFDCYALKNPASNYPWSSNVDNETGGSIPAYDSYQVLGQGIGGSIQPHIYEYGSLYRRKANTEGVAFINDANSAYKNKVGFRFVNDFSNAFLRDVKDWGNTTSNYLDMPAAIGKNGVNYATTATDFNKANGMLAGSQHVEWFSNKEITNGQAALRGLVADVTNRPVNFSTLGYTLNIEDNIGAMMVVNASGMTYHYALPVYNFEELSKFTNNNNYSRTISKSTPYAYTWLLTAITGPDYVDRGTPGALDEKDWGYWVKFDYGKWTDQHIWRNPVSGTQKDLDGQSNVVSSGKKQLYYLDAIKTRTHTALFVKNIKNDGKGVASVDAGGFETIRNGQGQAVDVPASTMKLSRILLFTNATLEKNLTRNFNTTRLSSYTDLRANSSVLQHTYTNGAGKLIAVHQGENVIDENDLSANLRSGQDLTKSAIRNIGFVHDNSLCNNTPNSYEMNFSTFAKTGTNQGKLTLKSIEVAGLNNARVIPPTSFVYVNNENYSEKSQDVWGTHKSDYTATSNEFIDQITTQQSATKANAWSLSQINTSLGATINISYESDRFKQAVLTPFKNFTLKSATAVAPNKVKFKLHKTEIAAFIPELAVGRTVEIRSFVNYVLHPVDVSTPLPKNERIADQTAVITARGVEAGEDVITVENQYLYNQLTTDKRITTPPSDPVPVYANINGGNMLVVRDETVETLGGGLRVKTIGLLADGVESITEYIYENGVTSYEPIKMSMNVPDLSNYKNELYKKYIPVVADNAFLPSPGVVYGKVTVQDKTMDYINNKTITGFGKTVYELQTFNSSMLPRRVLVDKMIDGNATKLNVISFKDLRNRIGLVKKVSVYGTNNALLSLKENIYLHDAVAESALDQTLATRFNNQGRSDQAFLERRVVNGSLQVMVTEVENYPIVLSEQKNTDYKTGVLTGTSRNLSFDFYTGRPTNVWVRNSYNVEYLKSDEAAYIPYPMMGHKIFSASNKHMLSQVSSTTVKRVSPNVATPVLPSDYTPTAISSAAATVWSNTIPVFDGEQMTSQPAVWRMKSQYSWIGNDDMALNTDGTAPLSEFAPYNFTTSTANDLTKWQKNNEVLLYNIFSKVTEASDINLNTSALLMSPKQDLTIASGKFCKRNEIAYAGVEFIESYNANQLIKEGNVSLGQGTVVNEFAHTGTNSLLVNKNTEGFKFTFSPDMNRIYRASTWVYLPGFSESESASNVKLIYKVNGQVIKSAQRVALKKAQSHYLIELQIDPKEIPTGLYSGIPVIEVICVNQDASRPAYFDDFRVAPLESELTTYVYDNQTMKLTHILDANNIYIRYQYDDAGKLIRTYRELIGRPVEKLVSQKLYNYGK